MAEEKDDADYGLTAREWLESDPVPLTPDIDVDDPEQRSAWMRANNEENEARRLELQARRAGGTRAPSGPDDVEVRPRPRLSATTVVPVRFLNAEHLADAADAAVQRITDEVRRLRDIVVAGG